jgi:TubC N-terminal docking domain
MTMIRLLAELHDAGIRIALNGDKIRAEPTRGAISESFLQRLTEHKPALRDFLTSPAGDTLRTLFDLAIDEGLPGAIVAGLSEQDLHASDGLSRHTLAAFLGALARHQRMAAAEVPARWTRAVACAGCGPVQLWPDAPDAVIGCPWCQHRKAGRIIPRPVTVQKQSKESKQT